MSFPQIESACEVTYGRPRIRFRTVAFNGAKRCNAIITATNIHTFIKSCNTNSTSTALHRFPLRPHFFLWIVHFNLLNEPHSQEMVFFCLIPIEIFTVESRSEPSKPPKAYNFPPVTATPTLDLNMDIASPFFHSFVIGS